MQPAPVEDVEREADDQPGETGVPRLRVLHDDDEPRCARPDRPDDREQRPLRRRGCVRFGRARHSSSSSRPPHAERRHRHMGDREREHRAERVHPPQEVDLPREQEERRADSREDDEREPRRLQLRVQLAERRRQLAVARHRVGDPRRADHAGVRGDEEDRRSEDADVDLHDRQHRAVQAHVLDEAEHRVVLEAERRGQAELRHVVAARRARRASPRARSTGA